MEQWWDAAITAAGEQPPADLPAAVAEELIALWSDLDEAMRRAGRRSWSVECDGLVVRIVMLSRLTAATSWQWIPEPLLASGVYQGILQSAGIEFTPPCPEEIHRVNPVRQDGLAELPGPIGSGTLTNPDRRWWHVELGDDAARRTMDVRVDEITGVRFGRGPYPFPSFPGREALTVHFLGPGGEDSLSCWSHDLYDGQRMRPERLQAWQALRERYGNRDESRVDQGRLLAPAA